MASIAASAGNALRRTAAGRLLALSLTSKSPSKRLLASFSTTSSTSSSPPDLAYIQQHYKIHRRGQDGHGSREYLLLPPDVKLVDEAVQLDPSLPAAALFAHRNILFGARSFLNGVPVTEVCGPLVKIAVEEAEEFGEQPQGMANLNGLCGWVARAIDNLDGVDDSSRTTTTATTATSQTLIQLQEQDPAALEAVRAMATGIPRPGHSVVGQGTYRDGKDAWQALAKEFIELGLGDEANLYRQHRGNLVAIEHLADTSPEYLRNAGGAMARFFFL